MVDPLCYNDESSEEGSTSYSDFCDDDAIRGAITPQPDATQSHGPRDSSPLPSTNISYYSSQDVVLGKRKALDGAEESIAGPLYSYKKRSLSDSIETDSVFGFSEAATLDSHLSDETLCTTQGDDTPTPCIIVRSVKIGPLRFINPLIRPIMQAYNELWTFVGFHGAFSGRSPG